MKVIYNNWAETQSGQKFHPFNELVKNFTLDDLVWGLARTTRYNGQYRKEIPFFSVAEHSVLMVQHMISVGVYSHQEKRDAAAHELSEGLIGDMVRSIKKDDAHYRTAEINLTSECIRRWNLSPQLPACVVDLDNRILVDERRQIMNKSGHHWPTDHLEPLGVQVQGWLPDRAAAEFKHLLLNLDFDFAT